MLTVASDRSSTHQPSGQGGDSLLAFVGLNDAESDGMLAHQPQPQAAGSSASQQQPGQGASIPKYVHILKPDTKTQHQENTLPSTVPFYNPVSYSSSVEMFCHILPTHLSGIHYPLAPVLLPLMYSGSTPSQIPAQSPNDTSPDAAFLQANTPYFLGPSPVSTHTPVYSLPVFNVLPTQGLYFPCDNDFSLVQNPKSEAQGSVLPTAERYNNQDVLSTFTALHLHVLQFQKDFSQQRTLTSDFIALSSNFPATPLEDSTDSANFPSSDGWTDDVDKLCSQATESLSEAQAQLNLSAKHRCCRAIPKHKHINFSLLFQTRVCDASPVSSFCPLSLPVQLSNHPSHLSTCHRVLSTKPVRYCAIRNFSQMLQKIHIDKKDD